MLTKVYLGVGSNLDRDNAILFAKEQLSKLFSNFVMSSVWQSRAIREAEPDYYNMVVGGETELSLEELLAEIEKIENKAGTELMFHNGTNFGLKRRLDIDILLFGNLVTTTPCKVPRHDIQDYPFVLCPLCEIDNTIVHPLLNIAISEIWTEMAPRLPEKMRVSKVDFDFSRQVPNWD